MTITWHPVSEHTFVTRVEPHGVNVGLIVGDGEAMLIDSGNTASQGAGLVASARQFSGVPVTHVVLTHGHHDHVRGLAGMGLVVSIAHEDLTEVDTDRRFSMALALDLGGRRVEMLHFGRAHTGCDVVVFVPGDNVVFTGDLVEEGGDPQIDESSSLAGWPSVLDGILGASDAHTRFVPGHGRVVDRDFVFMQRASLAMLHSTCDQLIRQGVTVDEAPGAAEWPFTPETVAAAVPHAYAELAAKGVVPKRHLPLL